MLYTLCLFSHKHSELWVYAKKGLHLPLPTWQVTRSTEVKTTQQNQYFQPVLLSKTPLLWNSSRNFSSRNVSDQRSVTDLHTQEQQNDLIIAAALTSMRKSPVLSPACHATPPSSTDSRYCRAGKAGVGVNSSMGVSAGHQREKSVVP